MEQQTLCWINIGKALLLLMLINGAPIISRNFLKFYLDSLRTLSRLKQRGHVDQNFFHQKIDWLRGLRVVADWPVDFGYTWFDQRPIFGTSKTWRGLFFAVLTGLISAPWLGLDRLDGALFALYSMLGDLLSSFIKRRAGYPESSCLRGVDTIFESLLPVFFFQTTFMLSGLGILWVVLLFSILEALLSPILYRLHIRKRPY